MRKLLLVLGLPRDRDRAVMDRSGHRRGGLAGLELHDQPDPVGRVWRRTGWFRLDPDLASQALDFRALRPTKKQKQGWNPWQKHPSISPARSPSSPAAMAASGLAWRAGWRKPGLRSPSSDATKRSRMRPPPSFGNTAPRLIAVVADVTDTAAVAANDRAHHGRIRPARYSRQQCRHQTFAKPRTRSIWRNGIASSRPT